MPLSPKTRTQDKAPLAGSVGRFAQANASLLLLGLAEVPIVFADRRVGQSKMSRHHWARQIQPLELLRSHPFHFLRVVLMRDVVVVDSLREFIRVCGSDEFHAGT